MGGRRKIDRKLVPPNRFGFVCEGETERDYLKIILGVRNPHKIQQDGTTNPSNLVWGAFKLLANRNDRLVKNLGVKAYQKIFVLCDTDKWTTEESEKIQKLFKENSHSAPKIELIVSNFCFEYVLGLHFEPNKNTLPKINANKPKVLIKHGYENHKSNPTRTRLMTDLKNAPDNCRAMYTALKSRDKTLQFNACTHWVERIKPENDPNSNFYVVYDCLASHNLLPEALKPLE